MAYYTGLTRITDNRHHWSDVLAGLAQGTIVALLTTRYLWPAYKRKWAYYLIEASEERSLLQVVPIVGQTGTAVEANANTDDDQTDQSSDQSSEGLSRSQSQQVVPKVGYKLTRQDEPTVRLSYDEFVV